MSGDDNTARFERIVQPHLGDAYALARWITGDRADAEDWCRKLACALSAPSAAMRAAIHELGC